jgi:hypothetical protein
MVHTPLGRVREPTSDGNSSPTCWAIAVEDSVTLTEVVAALCHKQRPDVTMENWIKSVTPDAIPGMRAAFIAEYVDFFRRMSDLKTATMLESLMPAIERSRDRAASMLTSIAGGTPTSSQASSA